MPSKLLLYILAAVVVFALGYTAFNHYNDVIESNGRLTTENKALHTTVEDYQKAISNQNKHIITLQAQGKALEGKLKTANQEAPKIEKRAFERASKIMMEKVPKDCRAATAWAVDKAKTLGVWENAK